MRLPSAGPSWMMDLGIHSWEPSTSNSRYSAAGHASEPSADRTRGRAGFSRFLELRRISRITLAEMSGAIRYCLERLDESPIGNTGLSELSPRQLQVRPTN